jgi:hypothetical protein
MRRLSAAGNEARLVAVTVGERGSRLARAFRFAIAFSIASAWTWIGAAPRANAQEPKAGDYYVESSDLGFKIRVPMRSDLVPPSPGDANLIAKFDPQTSKSVLLGKNEMLDLHCWLLKFDRREKHDDDKSPARKLQHADRDIVEWMKNNISLLSADGEPKSLEINKVAAQEYWFSGKTPSGFDVKLYAMVYHLKPDVDVAFALWGPGKPDRWMRFETPAKEMARSFRAVDVKSSTAAAASGASLRDRTRAKLQSDILKTPGWKLYETDHYFIVSNNDDKDFIEELRGRLEAVHGLYEADYPPAKAQELRDLAAKNKTGSGKDAAGSPPKEGDPPKEASGDKDEKASQDGDLRKFLDDGVDPLERSRCSVVRVCKDVDAYHSYGGPEHTAGYWNPVEQELVLYDARKVGGKSDTWATMNHEAFHQYIFYFYGNIAPHPWYNEGTGDFYSGYEYRNKKFTLRKFIWRTGTIQEAIQKTNADKNLPNKPPPHYFPLREFVQLSKAEYYGKNRLDIDPGRNYAQGWSFIYFLRTGKAGGAKNWDPKWDAILDTYLRTLAMTGKLDQAVDAAFKGVDFDALQASWAEYTLH